MILVVFLLITDILNVVRAVYNRSKSLNKGVIKNMKKGTFYLCFKDGYELVNGYIDTINGVEIGLHKLKDGYWQATHIKTGYYIISGDKTRKGIVECLPYWLKKINFESASVQKAIENMQEFLNTVAIDYDFDFKGEYFCG